jgi:uncharacterized protein (TIGR02996 family)
VSDEAAFLSAITANPEDDTLRLVYADWLQDRDDPRADYLRLEVRRHRMTPKQKRTEDPFHALQKLRVNATPDWLSRIDRVNRFSMSWPLEVCRAARRDGLVGQPLARVHVRSHKSTHFPKVMAAGDYLYVFAFRNRTLFVVARMRIERRVETTRPATQYVPAYTYTTQVEGSEGTPIQLDRAVSAPALARLSWYSGKAERSANLDNDGRLTTSANVSIVLRLTPRTAADLDAILRGETLS